MADRIRLGVVGAGNIADLQIAGYLEDPRCEVVAVCDLDPAAADAAARRWGASRRYRDLERCLADPEIDAVEILTPTHLHHRQVLSSLEAGKHVSVQKPLANSVPEALELARAAERSRKILRVSECFVHYPPLELAKQLIAEGAIGRPSAVRIRTVVGQTASAFQAGLRPEGYGWRLDQRSPGGHLFDDMVHKYAMALWLVDRDITGVQAVVRRRDLFFEPMVALFEYDDPGLLGTMEVNYAPQLWLRSRYYGADEFFEIQGDEGLLWVTRATGEMLDLAPVVLHRGDEDHWESRELTGVDADWASGFRRGSRHFIDALTEGTPAEMSPSLAVQVLQLCFAVYEASRLGERIDPRTVTGEVTAEGWAQW